ncbi:MAG: AI-2E family transporter [Balneolaceae bacterium]
MTSFKNYPLTVRVLVSLLLGISVIFVLIMTKQLLVPLFFAVLLSYALLPAANKLEQLGMPRIPVNFILIVATIAVIAGSFLGFGTLVGSFSEDLPDIRSQAEENLTGIQNTLINSIGISESRIESVFENWQESGEYVSEFFTATANTILAIALIPVYTFLLLLYRNKFKEFIFRLLPSEKKERMQDILTQTTRVVPKYMKGLVTVCLILIILNSAGFFIIGIEYALFLGVIAAFFNLIPYLGTVIGYGLVFLFVLATQSVPLALGVVVQFIIIQFIENNILTPNITGSYVQINPLVTIFSLIAGGTIWGLPGMFMVIPYLAILKIFCENIPDLKPVAFLLGTRGTEKYSISFKTLRKKIGWNAEKEGSSSI